MKRKTKSPPQWSAPIYPKAQARKAHFGGHTHHPELISEADLLLEQQKMAVAKTIQAQIQLPEISIAAISEKPRAKSRARLMYEWLSAWFASFLSWLSAKQKKRLLTLRGEKALTELQMLSNLYSATMACEGLETVSLQAAFGEAYYHILHESKRRTRVRAHSADEENYSHYLERFAKAAAGLE